MKIRNFKIKAIEKALGVVLATAIILSLSTLVSCSSDEEEIKGAGEANLNIMLTIQTRADSSYDKYGDWENHIDIDGHNFRIYFFTADKDDATATSDSEKNTLITSIYASATDITEVSEGKYTVIGTVTDVMTDYTNFKVVVLANWGSYPTVTAGVTTIDDLVEGNNTTFNASYYLSGINTSHYIPFFGVNEYTGVDWKLGTTITTNTTINMLSALAKVEVTFDENYIARFGSVEKVEIVRYNSKGYSAPKDVYNNDDYVDNGEPSLSSLHLYGNANDEDEADGPKTYSFVKEETGADTEAESWLIYLPEYSNMSTDYSYIRVTLADGTDEQIIYFGEYKDGVCTAYDTEGNPNDRFDIYRNYYYRFSVYTTLLEEQEVSINLNIWAELWEECFDNVYEFDVSNDN